MVISLLPPQRSDFCCFFTAAALTQTRSRKQPRCPSAEERVLKMAVTDTVDHNSAVTHNELMKCADECGNPDTKQHMWCALANNSTLTPKLRAHVLQPTERMQ